jgi:hypothetical protein
MRLLARLCLTFTSLLCILAPWAALAESAPSKGWGLVTGSRVTLRAQPGLDGARIGAFSRNTRLEWLGVTRGWVRVRHPRTGQTGWMSGDYLVRVPRPRRARRPSTPTSRTRADRPRSPSWRPRAGFRRKQRMFVYGDSLATNLFHGLESYAERAGFYTVRRRTRGATGLIRDDEFDWYARTLRHLRKDRPDILVVTFGGNDRQDITTGRGRIRRFSSRWWQDYRRRVNRYMAAVKRRVAEVYWLGLPVVRSRRMTADYAKFNRLYRELAAQNGITFVDTWRRFQARDGGYTPKVRGVDGQLRHVRNSDGIHFNPAGSLVLAQLVVAAYRRAQ